MHPRHRRLLLDHWISVYRVPETLLTDNGSQFGSRLMLERHRIFGIKGLFKATYHTNSNGQTESFNGTLPAAIRKPKEWDLHSDLETFAYNAHAHDTTGVTPFVLVLSRPPPTSQLENPSPTSALSKNKPGSLVN